MLIFILILRIIAVTLTTAIVVRNGRKFIKFILKRIEYNDRMRNKEYIMRKCDFKPDFYNDVECLIFTINFFTTEFVRDVILNGDKEASAHERIIIPMNDKVQTAHKKAIQKAVITTISKEYVGFLERYFNPDSMKDLIMDLISKVYNKMVEDAIQIKLAAGEALLNQNNAIYNKVNSEKSQKKMNIDASTEELMRDYGIHDIKTLKDLYMSMSNDANVLTGKTLNDFMKLHGVFGERNSS